MTASIVPELLTPFALVALWFMPTVIGNLIAPGRVPRGFIRGFRIVVLALGVLWVIGLVSRFG